MQCGLNALHYSFGELDGVMGPRTARAKAQFLANRATDLNLIAPPEPPASDYSSMVNYYGKPGDESQLVSFKFPYPMVLAWDKSVKVTKSRCHKRIEKPLVAALQELLDTYGLEWIKAHGLDLFGGIYNNRNARGGRTKSKHAWGAAIDLNPATNGNKTKWREDKIGQPGFADMPLEAIVIFERHGFKAAARAWGRDAMHMQFTT